MYSDTLTIDDVTPEIVRKHVWFTEVLNPFTLKRGYTEDEVDNFLDLIADKIEALLVENNNLRLKLSGGDG